MREPCGGAGRHLIYSSNILVATWHKLFYLKLISRKNLVDEIYGQNAIKLKSNLLFYHLDSTDK